jgi:hypothetical protein
MKQPSPRVILGLGVWVISFAVAFVLSLGIVYVWLQTDIETYSVKYFLLTVIPLGFMFLIPLDWLLGTKILPD